MREKANRRKEKYCFCLVPCLYGAIATDLIPQECVVLAWRKGRPQCVVINPAMEVKEALDSIVLGDKPDVGFCLTVHVNSSLENFNWYKPLETWGNPNVPLKPVSQLTY